MKIIIAGAGAVGTHLAKLLSDEKQDIILMDENEEKLSKLDSNFDLMTVNASPTSISGLKNAGVAGADLFIGVMPEESRNMTACMLATNMGAKKTVARIDNYEYLLPKHKEFFSQLGVHSLIYPEMLAAKRMGVTKTVAEVENIDYISMAESLDIGTVINKKMIAASHIYQMMLDADVSNVKCLTFANADVAEFTVKNGSRITKCAVKDAGLPKGATIGGLIRNGEGILVTGNTVIQPNDHVVVFCLGMMIKKIEKFFN